MLGLAITQYRDVTLVNSWPICRCCRVISRAHSADPGGLRCTVLSLMAIRDSSSRTPCRIGALSQTERVRRGDDSDRRRPTLRRGLSLRSRHELLGWSQTSSIHTRE